MLIRLALPTVDTPPHLSLRRGWPAALGTPTPARLRDPVRIREGLDPRLVHRPPGRPTAGGRDRRGRPLRRQVSGKFSTRPKLDELLAILQPGDAVVVTRLRRIGRSHQHLLDLVRKFGEDASTSSCWSRASTPPPPVVG
ncbi:recombinase family protein [Nocardia asteroides]|uniref:recombinase family protein n=1 Tax=Nocardia asteroides TaxID=1824 RepID=UPI0037CA7451